MNLPGRPHISLRWRWTVGAAFPSAHANQYGARRSSATKREFAPASAIQTAPVDTRLPTRLAAYRYSQCNSRCPESLARQSESGDKGAKGLLFIYLAYAR